MLVKVFIRRHIKEGKDKEAFTLLKKLRSLAMNQEGYISGETLIRAEDPQEIMVVSTWHGMENWAEWRESEQRKAIDSQLTKFLDTSTIYEPFVFSKFRLSVQKGFPEPVN